jgi:NAD(P)-dependent dehydrogenase (short-subunit alcohol dehydrogenase family)
MPTRRIFLVAALLASFATLTGSPSFAADSGPVPTVFITGSNRGIGLEFVRQYAALGWRVIATSRDPAAAAELKALAAKNPRIVMEALDVTNRAQVAALAAKYRGTAIDVLINNAGILGDRDKQRLDSLDPAEFELVMATNAYAPLEISAAFLENVAASQQKKIVAITSGLGSLAGTQRFGGFYAYRMSKTALNMAMRALQADVRSRGILVGVIAPGVVDTRLLAQSGFQGESLRPEQSVKGMIQQIGRLSPDNAAVPTLYTGQPMAW